MRVEVAVLGTSYIEPCFGIGLSLSLICQPTSAEDNATSVYLPTDWLSQRTARDGHVAVCRPVSVSQGQFSRRTQSVLQTASAGLRHPSFGGRCRKAMLGACQSSRQPPAPSAQSPPTHPNTPFFYGLTDSRPTAVTPPPCTPLR